MGENPEEADINGTITYSLFWVMAARDYALYGGDPSFLQGVLAYCDKLMAAVWSKADAQGLLPTHRFDWLYLDWAEVQTAGYSAFLNFLHVMALDAAAALHQAVGREDAAAWYTQKAEALRFTCREFFWDTGKKCFRDNGEPGKPGTHVSRQSNALAVLSGVCTPGQRQDVLRQVLLNKSVAPVGTPYMMFFEARALAVCGERRAMLTLIRDYWGSMLDAGASTFWEAHDVTLAEPDRYAFYGRPFAKSLCHAWSSGPVPLLSAEMFGLRPLKCGWSEFTVDPAESGLDWACAEIPTPHGPIRVQVAGRRMTVNVPAGTCLVRGAGDAAERHNGPIAIEFDVA
jgi:alpha-L-rhamnosidase